MINKVILVGNIGADPEIRAFESGNSVARFRLATTEKFKREGEVQTVSEWHNVEAWGQTAAIIDQYVRKGDRLYVEGSIHYQEYTTRQGEKRYQTIIRAQSVKMLTSRRETEQTTEQTQEQPAAQPQAEPSNIPPAVSIPPAPPIDPAQANQEVDELPF